MTPPPANEKPVVVGVYGVPGSGKTHLLGQLKRRLSHGQFAFFEGSEVLDKIVIGGLEVFKRSSDEQKLQWRNSAITHIQDVCIEASKSGVVTGHFMFWPEENADGHVVCTENDLKTYTHIVYLDVPAEIVLQRRLDHVERNRPVSKLCHRCRVSCSFATMILL